MIYIKTDVPKELSGIEEELKTISNGKNPVCFLFLKIENNKMNFQKTLETYILETRNCLSRVQIINENWFNNL